MQKLIALKTIRYDRETYRRNDEFRAKEADAKLLCLIGKAKRAEGRAPATTTKTIMRAPRNRAMIASNTPPRPRGRPAGSKNTYQTKAIKDDA